MLVSPQKIRWLFVVKSFVVPPAWLAMLIWSFVKVPAKEGLFNQHTALSGSALSYAWLSAMNSALGIYGTLAVNIPDFTVRHFRSVILRISGQSSNLTHHPHLQRYAKNEQAQRVQLLIIPIAFTLVAFTGIAVTSAGIALYGGAVLWDPLRLIDRWDQPDNRAAAFFAALSFALATLGTNVSANSLSAANDMTVLFPRYVNIRRGQVVCAVLGGWALCPWEILASAQGFLAFMNGYTVFLGPFAGIMVADVSVLCALCFFCCCVIADEIGGA